MKSTHFLQLSLFAFLMVSPVVHADSAVTYLKCGLNEVGKDGLVHSLYTNACNALEHGGASVDFRPDGDDFSLENASFDAKVIDGVLSMSLEIPFQSPVLLQFPASLETLRSISTQNLRLDCSITTTAHYENGVDVCH